MTWVFYELHLKTPLKLPWWNHCLWAGLFTAHRCPYLLIHDRMAKVSEINQTPTVWLDSNNQTQTGTFVKCFRHSDSWSTISRKTIPRAVSHNFILSLCAVYRLQHDYLAHMLQFTISLRQVQEFDIIRFSGRNITFDSLFSEEEIIPILLFWAVCHEWDSQVFDV